MKITLVGMGSGAPGSLTAAGLETLRGAELIIGARRLLENLPEGCTANRAALYKTDEICALLRQTDCAEAAVVCRVPGASHCATEGGIIAERVRGALGIPLVEIEVPPLGDATAPAAETRLEALMETARARRKESR